MRLLGILGCAILWATSPAAAQTPPVTERFDLERRAGRYDLPGRLDEISGLAHTPDGRLFAHGDEEGTVHEIDPTTGKVGKRFHLGRPTVPGDFEGMAIVGHRFFLVTSLGWLYEFREAGDGEHAAYRVTNSGVGDRCEVEGLEYDPDGDLLLLPCKTTTVGSGLVIHRLPVDPDTPRPPPLRISLGALEAVGLHDGFRASGITIDAEAGRWILVSATEEALLEIEPDGRVVTAFSFPGERHVQPEGITILPDGPLVIADEANGREARLTLYRR